MTSYLVTKLDITDGSNWRMNVRRDDVVQFLAEGPNLTCCGVLVYRDDDTEQTLLVNLMAVEPWLYVQRTSGGEVFKLATDGQNMYLNTQE